MKTNLYLYFLGADFLIKISNCKKKENNGHVTAQMPRLKKNHF